MTEPSKAETLSLDVSSTARFAPLCARFGTAWQEALVSGGEPPGLAEYLAGITDADSQALRTELERIDRTYRERLHTAPQSSNEADSIPDSAGGSTALPAGVGDRTIDYDDSRLLEKTSASGRHEQSFSFSGDVEVAAPPDQAAVRGYEIVGELGRGGMGVVYKAQQLGLNRWVALKMVLAGAHASGQQLARFRVEAEAVARLQHPNIVQVYEIGESSGLPYFSLEFVDGGCLTDKIHRQPQAPREAAHLIETIAHAIQYAHERGIIHRDLKPANVLLTAQGMPKITDFGLAKRLEGDASHTKSGSLLGTPNYMSPEQARGEAASVGPSTDVYALGVMLYELITGRPPFEAATVAEMMVLVENAEPLPPRRLVPKTPRDLETICLKCLQKDPQRRYTTARALADDLRRFLSDEPILARPVRAWERLARWCVRNPGKAVLTGTVAMLLLVVALGSLAAAYRINLEKAEADRQRELAEHNALGEKMAREEAVRNRALAERHADEARQAQALAGKQAQVALGTVYDVVTATDEKLRTKAEMGPLRKDLLELAMKRLDQIARDAATSGMADRTMGVALQRMGTFYEQMGMTERQVEVYQRSLDIFNRLMSENPEEDWNKFDAAISYDSLGEIGREIEKDPGKLFDYYSRSLELRKQLVAAVHSENPALSKRQRSLAVSYVKLGMLSLEVGDPAKAREYGEHALTESLAAAELEPSKVDNRRELLSAARLLLGKADCRLGAEAQAREHLSECRRLRQDMVQADSLNAYAKQELGRVLDALGDLELEYGHTRASVDTYERARAVFDALCQKDRGNPEFQWYLANTNYHLGTARQLAGEDTASKRHFQECLRVRERLQKDDAKNIQRRIELMLVQARLGDRQSAAKTADDVRVYAPKHPGKLFSAACGYALCVSPGPADGDTEQRANVSTALDTLRQAISCGFRDRRALEAVPDLHCLHGDAGYQALLNEIAKP